VAKRRATEEDGCDNHNDEGGVGQYGGSTAAKHEFLTSVTKALQVSGGVEGRHMDPHEHAKLKRKELDHEDKAEKRSFILQCFEASNPKISQHAVSLLSSMLGGMKPEDLI
jgi:hypothetical protein